MNDKSAEWMNIALEEAHAALIAGEVPVGAIVVYENKIIARAHNEVEQYQDPTRHAEMLAVQRACATLDNWRLSKADLYVTLEPCPMCIGAILLSRIDRLFFGAPDPVQGAVGSLFDLSEHALSRQSLRVYRGVEQQRCQAVLQQFFATLREGEHT